MRLVVLPGLDGGSALAGPFLECLPGATALELPDEPLEGEALLRWAGERMPAGPFVLVGQSYTTGLALELAARHRAAGLVLAAPVGFRRARAGLSAALRWAPEAMLRRPPPGLAARLALLGWDAPAEAVAAFGAAAARASPSVLASRLREMGRALARPCPAVRCPTLCLHARRDGLLTGPPRGAARHVWIDGPHVLLMRRPRESAAAVMGFANVGATPVASR